MDYCRWVLEQLSAARRDTQEVYDGVSLHRGYNISKVLRAMADAERALEELGAVRCEDHPVGTDQGVRSPLVLP